MDDTTNTPTAQTTETEGAENLHLITVDCLRNARENLDMLIETLEKAPDADQRVSTIDMAFNTWMSMAVQHRAAYMAVRGMKKQ
ncbi:hypothetical protein [Xanthobacter versatilis]|uniref:hypothetical protein n=1 Tax=Xanthobacter autotrophicus (strain ATCC BAA-1158 / Py2) TaxID=78245 RepID=UPI0037280E87